jgi:molecular chaperone HscB
MDHFQCLGLPRRFSVDPEELERAYLARSRAVHPDYHLAASASELAASLELAAALNEAYTTLRDPFARAEYLLALHGGPTASEHKQMPPAFLAEMLEARERIEQGRGDPERVARLDAEYGNRFSGIMAEVGQLFDRIDATPAEDPARADLLARVRGLLNAAKYVRGLIRDLHAD